ncbi:MAG: hypothetical protein ACREEM_01710, partial [Blastocatellia bacterium]
ELPREELEELEERFLHDAELFEPLLALRDDLIDDYLRGKLSPRQLSQFKRYFLATPQQRERVENARALMRAVAAEPVAEPTVPRRLADEMASRWQRLLDLLRDNRMTIGVAVAMALLLITGPLIFGLMRLRLQLTQTQQEVAEQRARADRLEQLATAPKRAEPPLPDPAPPRPEENVIALLTLTSDYDQGLKGSRGGGGLRKLAIPSDRGLVVLRLRLADAGYRSYRVTLKEVSSGKLVRTLTGLRAQSTRSGKVVTAQFPASSFSGPTKDYLVILDGITAEGNNEPEIDKYSFRAEKK